MIGARNEFCAMAARHALAHDLHQALDSLGVPAGATALLAVSGGCDSMALLAAGAGLVHRGRVQPIVAHVDHGLRPESALEGDAVQALAERACLRTVRLRVHLEQGGNLSARARAARYSALADAAKEQGAQWVATAHHADDQLETMVMALGRGAGLARLAGMRASRALGVRADGIRLIRPLLGVQREFLRDACRQLDVTWCEDPGNALVDRPRGAVRHRVLPELDAVWPGCAERSARTAVLLRWAADQLARQAQELLQAAGSAGDARERGAVREPSVHARGTFDRETLRKAPLAVVAEAVRISASEGRDAIDSCDAHDAPDGSTVWLVARAIKDAAINPRVWTLAPGIEARVTARNYCASSLPARQRP